MYEAILYLSGYREHAAYADSYRVKFRLRMRARRDFRLDSAQVLPAGVTFL